MLSRICEEFHCTPLEAMQQPLALVRRILLLRNYAAAKGILDRPDVKQENLPDSPNIERVLEIQAELGRRRREERLGKLGPKAENAKS